MEERKETMADFEKELEASFRTIKEGDIISGTVISVTENEVTLDLQYYAQGIMRAEDCSSDPGFSILRDIHPGDVIEATVISSDDGAGNILLSRKEAVMEKAWDVLKQEMEDGTVLTVKVSEVVKAGVAAYAEGIRGFIPASQLALSYVEDLEPYLGRELKVKVITVDEEKQKLVLSAKAVAREEEEEAHRHRISMLVPGTVLEGTVESLMPYGAFVNLGDGLSGLVHISQICQKRIKKPSEVLSVGDKVKVKILNTDNGKVSLSIKAVEEERIADELEESQAFEYSSGEEATTTLGDLFKNLKL